MLYFFTNINSSTSLIVVVIVTALVLLLNLYVIVFNVCSMCPLSLAYTQCCVCSNVVSCSVWCCVTLCVVPNCSTNATG
jgi:hypothetical protein